jgi:hypothetical protein
VALREVVVQWLRSGIETGEDVECMDSNDQAEFIADVFTEEPDWIYDAFSEAYATRPSARADLIEAIRSRDFNQIGASLDKYLRKAVIEGYRNLWDSEFTQISEQESRYDPD